MSRFFQTKYSCNKWWETHILAKVKAGPPAQLGFGIQPGPSVANTVISPAVTVQVQDASGNINTADNGRSITIALTAAGGATLSGTLTRTTASGVATFNDLAIDVGGTYSFTATTSGLTSGVSNSFPLVDPGALPGLQLWVRADPVPTTPFDPSFLSNLVGWYKGDAGLFKDTAGTLPATVDGDAVGRWADQSGHANHLLMISSHNATLKTALLNGLNVVRGDGTATILQAAFTLNNPIEIYMVAQQRAWVSGTSPFDGKNSSSTLVYQAGTTPNIFEYSNGNVTGVSGWTLNTFRTIGFRWDTTTGTIRFGGVETSGALTPANPGGITVFNRGSGANAGAFDIAELVVSSSILTASQRTNLEAYFTSRWGTT